MTVTVDQSEPGVCSDESSTVKWSFIDKDTYLALKNSKNSLPLDKFKGLTTSDSEVIKRLSPSLKSYLIELNASINYALHGEQVIFDNPQDGQTELVKDFLNAEESLDSAFYEILPIDNENMLVVVSRGFLYHLTQSKDALLQFILACLGCLDRFNCTSLQLNRLYLRLLYVQGYHLLIKARVDA